MCVCVWHASVWICACVCVYIQSETANVAMGGRLKLLREVVVGWFFHGSTFGHKIVGVLQNVHALTRILPARLYTELLNEVDQAPASK